MLSNQPQGGFKTRKPTPPLDPWGMYPASGNQWQPGIFNFWDQPSQKRQPAYKQKRGPQGKPFFW